MAKWIILLVVELLFVAIAKASLTRHEIRHIREELKGLEAIRVGITRAPGLGHQAAGAAVVERLRELGYEGQIEIVYDTIQTAKKLQHFWKFFNDSDIGVTKFYKKKGLVFRSLQSLETENAEELSVAFMGADDLFTMPPELRVQHLIKLQPFQWDRAPEILSMSEKSKSGIAQQFLYSLQNRGYPFLPPKPQNVDLFLKKELGGFGDRSLFGFFKEILAVGGKFDLLPVYGHGVRKGNAQLLTLIAGLIDARKFDLTQWQNGVVIPIFNDLSEQRINELKVSIDEFRSNPDTPSVKLDVIALNEFEAAKIGGERGRAHIVLVPVGSVPKKVFDYVFSQATLPPIIEGVNSLNFMGLLGTPYLPSALHEGFHFYLPQFEAERVQSDTSKKGDLGFLLWSAWQELSGANPNQIRSLGEFYRSASRRRFEINTYFEKFKLNRKDQDQVGLAISEFLRRTGVHLNPRVVSETSKLNLRCQQQLNQ